MDPDQARQILDILQGLNNRVSSLEQRMTVVERSLGNLSGPSTTGRAPRRSNHNGNTSNSAMSSHRNASFLPFVLVAIALKYQHKLANDTGRW